MNDIQKLTKLYENAMKAHNQAKDLLGYDNHFLKVAEETKDMIQKIKK